MKSNHRNLHLKPKIGDKRMCPICLCEVVVKKSMIKWGKYLCSKCAYFTLKKYRVKNMGKVLSQNREWSKTEKGKKAHSINTKKQRIKYPQKYKARLLVQSALRNGSLKKKSCEKCGKAKTHAHHEDYKKPLNVIWLCEICHRERHGTMIAEKRRSENG